MKLDCNYAQATRWRHIAETATYLLQQSTIFSSVGIRCIGYSTRPGSADRTFPIIGFIEDAVHFLCRQDTGCPRDVSNGGNDVYRSNTVPFSQRCSTTLHYKRGKQRQGKLIIHLIFTIQPDNLA